MLRLLQPPEFLCLRHEHLYKRLEHFLIRSELLLGGPVTISWRLLDERTNKYTRVLLCTLSMLSNSFIEGIARQVPVQFVIFDEASQIEVACRCFSVPA
jgi:regulator of nonsense transcripts 1